MIYFIFSGIIIIAFAIILKMLFECRQLFKASGRLKERLGVYMNANEDLNPEYFIQAFGKGYEVIRISRANGEPIITNIKYFEDEDSDFAYREAEELLNHLNSKSIELC